MPERLPLKPAQRLLGAIRKRYFTIDPPDDMPGFVLDITHDELEAILRSNCWEGAGTISYNYKGEQLNLRRPDGTDDNGDQMVLHLRTFDLDSDAIFGVCHREKSRYEHWADHYNEVGFSWDEGQRRFGEVLTDLSVGHERASSFGSVIIE